MLLVRSGSLLIENFRTFTVHLFAGTLLRGKSFYAMERKPFCEPCYMVGISFICQEKQLLQV